MMKTFSGVAGLLLIVLGIYVAMRAFGLTRGSWVLFLPFTWVGRLMMYSRDIRSRVDLRRKGIWVRRFFLVAAFVLLWWNIWLLKYCREVFVIPEWVCAHELEVDLWFVSFKMMLPFMFVVGNNLATALLAAVWILGWSIICTIPAQMMKVDDFREATTVKVVKENGEIKYERKRFGLIEVAFDTLKKVKGYVESVNMINSVSYVVKLRAGAMTDQTELSQQIPTMEVASGLTWGGITQVLNVPNAFRVRVSRGLPIIVDGKTGEVRGNVSIDSMPFHPEAVRRWMMRRPNPISRWEFPLALDPEVVWANLKQDDVNFGLFGKMGLGKTRLFAWICYCMHRIDRLCFTVLIDLSKEGRGLHAYQYDQGEISERPDAMTMREHMEMLRPLPNFLLITTLDEMSWFLEGLRYLEEFRSQMIKDHPGTEKIGDFEDIDASPWIETMSDFDVFDPQREFRIHYAVEEVGSTWRQFAGVDRWEKNYSELCGFVFRCRDMKYNADVLTQHPTMDEIGRIRPYLTRCGFGLDHATNQFVYGFGFTSRQAGGLFSIQKGQQSSTIGFAIAPNCHPSSMSDMMSNAVSRMSDEELKECLLLKRLFTRQQHPLLLQRMRDLKWRAHKAREIELVGTWQQNRDARREERLRKGERLKKARESSGPIERKIDFRKRRN